MVSLMQNEGKTHNKKAMIMVSFDDFSVPSENRMFIFWLFRQFTTQLYNLAITDASNRGLIYGWFYQQS